MAPPHRMVPALMDNLFNWMNEVKEKGIIERVGSTKNGIWKINEVE